MGLRGLPDRLGGLEAGFWPGLTSCLPVNREDRVSLRFPSDHLEGRMPARVSHARSSHRISCYSLLGESIVLGACGVNPGDSDLEQRPPVLRSLVNKE